MNHECHQGHLLDATASFTPVATSGRRNHPALGFQPAAQVAVFSWPRPKDHWCVAQRNTTYQGFITSLQLSLINGDELILDLSFTAYRPWCCLGPFASLACGRIPQLQLPGFSYLVVLLPLVVFSLLSTLSLDMFVPFLLALWSYEWNLICCSATVNICCSLILSCVVLVALTHTHTHMRALPFIPAWCSYYTCPSCEKGAFSSRCNR